jgi:hypothetical protein
MVFEAGLAGKFSNIGGLETMRYSALAWWYPCAKEAVQAMKKGALL